MYPDEFGYWASAAEAAGYDWSEVASLGSYYSFGYSLILLPILKLFGGGVLAYRAAIAVNMLCMLGGMLLLLGLMKKLFPYLTRDRNIFICGIAALYPPWIFYMQMTLAESLLMFLFLLDVYLLAGFLQKPDVLTAILLAVALIYGYCVHMRTVGILLACGAVLLLWGGKNRRLGRYLFLFGAALLPACLVVALLKKNVILKVFTFADAETLSVNDYGSQWQKLKDIVSPGGFLSLIQEIIGKFYYMGLASFGLFYWSFQWCVRESLLLLKKLRRGKDCYLQNYLGMFLFLSVTAEVLISSIYMHGAVKMDSLLYGRYNEFLMPVFLALGILILYRSRHPFLGSFLAGGLPGLMLPVLFSYIGKNDLEGVRGYFVSGISSFIREDIPEDTSFLWKAWLLGFALCMLAAVFVTVSKKRKKLVWLLGGILAAEVFMGLTISAHYTYRINEVIYPDLAIVDTIMEKKKAGDTVCYLDEGTWQFIDFQQMQMPQVSIHVIRENELDELDTRFLILCRDSSYCDRFDKSYHRKMITSLFILYYDEPEEEIKG